MAAGADAECVGGRTVRVCGGDDGDLLPSKLPQPATVAAECALLRKCRRGDGCWISCVPTVSSGGRACRSGGGAAALRLSRPACRPRGNAAGAWPADRDEPLYGAADVREGAGHKPAALPDRSALPNSPRQAGGGEEG